jgi:hypothetical protein
MVFSIVVRLADCLSIEHRPDSSGEASKPDSSGEASRSSSRASLFSRQA